MSSSQRWVLWETHFLQVLTFAHKRLKVASTLLNLSCLNLQSQRDYASGLLSRGISTLTIADDYNSLCSQSIRSPGVSHPFMCCQPVIRNRCRALLEGFLKAIMSEEEIDHSDRVKV